MSTFTVSGLSAGYQGHPVISDVALTVAQGEAVALAGRNGMGKTTTLKALMALSSPRVTAGSVRFGQTELAGRKPHDVARAGIGYVPQGRRIFPSLTVREHLEVVARPGQWTVEKVHDLFPRLAERSGHRAGTLSGGEQQMLAIARALMTNPRLLLLDEPSEGLAPQLVAEVGRTIAQLKAEGQSIVLVEQNIKLTLDLADDVVIINTGRVVFRGPASGIKLDDAIVSQHLGVF